MIQVAVTGIMVKSTMLEMEINKRINKQTIRRPCVKFKPFTAQKLENLLKTAFVLLELNLSILIYFGRSIVTVLGVIYTMAFQILFNAR